MKSKLFFAKKALITALALVIGTVMTFSVRPNAAFAEPQLPDIRVKIFASSDGTVKNQILDKSIVRNLGKCLIRFTISNNGSGQAKNFTYKAVVRVDGAKVFDPPAETITLDPGQSKTFVATILHGRQGDFKVEAKLIADIGNFVREVDETNNSRNLNYQVINVF